LSTNYTNSVYIHFNNYVVQESWYFIFTYLLIRNSGWCTG